MPVSLEHFVKGLVAAGLSTADDVKALVAELPAGERPTDGEGLAKVLEGRGKLTPFQSKHLLADKAAALSVGEYLLVDRIGAGGMGQVFKAKHRRMQRIVALKMMSPEAMKDEAAVRRFQREARSAAKLEHLNIVTAYDAGQQGRNHYLVMQYVEGGDLSNIVKAKGPLGVDKAVNFILQAARGLAFAHAEGIVHRDIKPANLLIDKKGCVKILDMGLARVVTGNDELTGSEQVMGTVDYMSPEQASEAKEADARSDIYSLGCTMWYLLTGKRLFEGDTIIARLVKHRDAPRPSLVEVRDDAPWSLEQTLHKMIARKADERFQTMDEVIRALDQVHAGAGTGGMGSSVLQDADLAQFLSGISQLQKGGASRLGGSSGSIRPGSTGALGSGALGSGALGSGALGSGSLAGLSGPTSGSKSAARPSSSVVETRAVAAAGADTDSKLPKRKSRISAAGILEDRRKLLLAAGAAAAVLVVGAVAWSLVGSKGEPEATAAGVAAAVQRPAAPALLKTPFTAAAAKAAQQGWAAHLGIPVVSQNSLGMRLVLIPPGEYLMGSTPQEVAAILTAGKQPSGSTVIDQVKAQAPQHRVVITRPFLLGETEVTIGQYARFVAATSWKTGWEFNRPTATDNWRRPGFDASDDTAATRLDRGDVAAFCNWLSLQEKLPRGYDQSPTIGWIPLAGSVGYRLPTDAQWEYACRAGTTTAFSFGDDPSLLDKHAWHAANSQNRVQPVGRKLPNAFGLFDMHGNVYEWMLDDYAKDFYSRSPTNDPANLGMSRDGIYRGGQFGQNIGVFLRSDFRRSSEGNFQLDKVGFRISRPIDAKAPHGTFAPTTAAAAPAAATGAPPAAAVTATVVNFALPSPVAGAGEPAVAPSTTIDFAAERKAAEWVLAMKGKVTVKPTSGAPYEATTTARLPPGPFAVHKIWLQDCRSVGDADLSVLGKLAEVTELQLGNCGVGGRGLADLGRLTTLRLLGLDGLQVTDADLAALGGMAGLESLELMRTRASEDGLERLPLGNLKRLKIGGIVVGNRLTTVLRDRAANLSVLHVADAAISDGAMAALVGLKNLTLLELNGGTITDAGIKHLSSLPALSEVWLRGLSLTDAGLKHLESLKNLRRLKLNGMKFSAEALAALYAALPTTEILVDDFSRIPKPFPLPAESPGSAPAGAAKPNTLSAAEQADGWRLLFDGVSLAGWETFRSTAAPKGWWAVEGQLRGDAGASFLATIDEFTAFELSFEFRGTADANSGVYYCVDVAQNAPTDSGPEFELDADSPTTGMMWDVGPTSGLMLNTMPQGWCLGRITVAPGQSRHVFADPTGKVLFEKTYLRDSEEFRNSNKGKLPYFWQQDRGKITLQAMNGSVAFRNLKIRVTK